MAMGEVTKRQAWLLASFINLDAVQLQLNEKRKDIVKTAVRAASGQGTVANCTPVAPCMNH